MVTFLARAAAALFLQLAFVALYVHLGIRMTPAEFYAGPVLGLLGCYAIDWVGARRRRVAL